MGGKRGGRPPKTTAAHKKDGTFVPCRHGDRTDIELTGSLPEVPAALGPDGRLLWETTVSSLPAGTFAELDYAGLQMTCEHWDRYRSLTKAVCAIHPEIDAKAYSLIFNCMVKCAQRFEALMGRFGLSPVDRARFKVPPKEEMDELDLLNESSG